MRTAVDAVFTGKQRTYNRRFVQMCSHYLVDPVACTPASGWEKGQVENQVGTVRQRFFAPRVKVKSYEELNAWLADRCVAWAKAHRHPETPERTIWEIFEEERPSLVPYRGPFDGFNAVPAARPLSSDQWRTGARCRRPASSAPTVTSTRSRRARSVVPSRSGPMPSGSRSARVSHVAPMVRATVANARCRGASARFRSRQDGLRSLALRSRARPQARGAEE
jgi:hypothetical protein